MSEKQYERLLTISGKYITNDEKHLLLDYIKDLQQERDKYKTLYEKALESSVKDSHVLIELEKWLNEQWKKPLAEIYVSDVVKKIQELKGGSDE